MSFEKAVEAKPNAHDTGTYLLIRIIRMINLKIADKEKPTDEKEDNHSVIELKITNEAIELTDSYSRDSIIMTNACWSELVQAVNEKRGDL